jgi:hypothetical protein
VKAAVALCACVLAGLAAGAVWTWLQPDRYRADARLLVRPPTSRIAPAVEALAESSLVESNVAQTLHLSSPPHVAADLGKGGVLTVSVEAGSRERARQIDAEAVLVLTQKVEQRFGSTLTVSVTLLDPAHADEQTSPTVGRNFLITGLIGLVAGLAALAALVRGRPRAAAAAPRDPAVERRLRARIDQVAKRERALAKRAGDLAARERSSEQRLAEREAALRGREAELGAQRRAGEEELAKRKTELEEAQAAVPEPVPEPEPEPTPAPQPEAVPTGAWTIELLEQRVAQRRERFPDQADEWTTYLYFLREHASIDGSLPRSFDSLIADVFADAIS